MKTKQLLAAALSAATLLASLPAALAADGDAPASRGAVCAALLAAADDYNPDVTAADIMHQLHRRALVGAGRAAKRI